jgi:hypothetical protein
LSPPSLNIIASQVAFERRTVVTIDFPAAYLNAFIKKRIYIKLPANVAPLFITKHDDFKLGLLPTGQLLTLLNKAMYCTLEAAELWNEDVALTFFANGFTANPMDSCVLNAVYNGAQVTAGIYVDDVIPTSVSDAAIEWVLTFLGAAYGKLTEHHFLGRIFDFSAPGSCIITMPKHIDNLLVLLGSLRTLLTSISSASIQRRHSLLLIKLLPSAPTLLSFVISWMQYALRVIQLLAS